MRTHLPSRLLALALVGVIVGMAAFSLWQRDQANENLSEILKAQEISDAYNTAHIEMLGVEKSLIVWGGTQDQGAFLQAVAHGEAHSRALKTLQRVGDEDDRLFAQAVLDFGEAFSALMAQGLGAEDPAAGLEALAPEFTALYDNLIRDVDADEFERTQQRPADAWGLVSPLGNILEQRADAEQERAAAITNEIDASWDRQTPYSVAIYSLGTVLVLALVVSTFAMSRRESRTRAEVDALRRAVTTDPLTGLGNRRGFEEELKRRTGPGSSATLSLAIMDLDEFKEANDTFGHDRGDTILRDFAGILAAHAPAGVSAYRIGGDEFALILPDVGAEAAFEAAESVRAIADEALGTGVTVSIGVGTLAGDESLLRQQADAALYEAKLRGRNIVVLYHDDGHSQPLFPAAKLAAVRQLLVDGNVHALFQPIWDLHHRRLLAYEALSRPDARYGLSGPQQAFDIAERFGRAADLDRICRQHILESAKALPEDVDLFINLSPYTLTHQSFDPETLIGEIERAELSTARVVFEITERSQVAPEAIAEGVSRLRAAGFRVALDDVGSGNNGLEMLRKVEFEYVKVDRGVLISAQASGTGRAALMAILAFSAESRALVVAEGIEDEGMFDLVKEVTHAAVKGTPGLIHGVQGYLFGRPAAAEDAIGDSPATLAA